MSTLLIHLKGNKSFNRTIFPPRLYIYDDLLIYKKRYLFQTREITISYNQISQVNLIRGVLFAEVNIITTGDESLRVRYVSKSLATQAKRIIDQKIYHAHAKHRPEDTKASGEINSYEKSLARLKELLNKGMISNHEYEQKKRHLLDSIH